MPQASFDLVIIGSGPSSQKAALNAAKLGKRVAMIDRKELVGGVCIHTGTIPSKAMREAILLVPFDPTAFGDREIALVRREVKLLGPLAEEFGPVAKISR